MVNTMNVDNLLKEIKKKKIKVNESNIKKAFEFAKIAHGDQKRISGEPYFIHPYKATLTLIQKMNPDEKAIIACLLHDVIDDTPFTKEDIKQEFGEEVTFLVNGVTKLGKIKYRGVERQIENLKKMFLAMAEDIRVILIKLADRHHNMQTLNYLPKEKQYRIALETLEIYASLANRLGIGQIKGELEDLAFPYVYPKEYKWLIKNVQEKYHEREQYLKRIKPIIEKELKRANINFIEVQIRAKFHYSLYKKLLRYNKNINEVHDLAAMRIIVNTIEECYATLGLIHKFWTPLPGKIKDYIALPKPNGYQSLHTTVFCVDGKITEFQIRTLEMHEQAEYGIAAQWFYDEKGKPKSGAFIPKKLRWVQQLIDWQKNLKNNTDFLENLKIEFFKDRIFVFTPKGDVIDLPEGAVPIDFAYQIHSEIGNHCLAAKINNKMAKLDTILKNGDIVEIITQKNKSPSPSWLNFVKTNYAKNKIKSYLEKTGKIKKTNIKILKIELKIKLKDRVGLLKDIFQIFAKEKINIESISTDHSEKGYPLVTINFSLKEKSVLDKLIKNLNKVKGMKEINQRIL